MKPLTHYQAKDAVKSEICPDCEAVPFFTKDWDVIMVNENLMYCKCDFCKNAFKFRRRALRHYKDSCGWEYLICNSEGNFFGVRGYSIEIDTYKKIWNQFHALKAYFRSGFSEIDDLFKKVLNDDSEGIFNSLSPVFSDEKYYKDEKVIQNWHYDEQYDRDDDDLLAELDNNRWRNTHLKPLTIHKTKDAVKSEICPNCDADPFSTKDWNVIIVNENLMYCRCNFCKSAFKFKRRLLSHYRDSCGWEYIIRGGEGKFFAIRGYSIRIKTFENIYTQFHALKTYFSSGFCEIDDLFKEILNDDSEAIFNSLSPMFSDEKYFKGEKIIQNWHYDEQYDRDDDDLLAELVRM